MCQLIQNSQIALILYNNLFFQFYILKFMLIHQLPELYMYYFSNIYCMPTTLQCVYWTLGIQ